MLVFVVINLALFGLQSCATEGTMTMADSALDMKVTYVGSFNRAVDSTYGYVCYYQDGGNHPVCFKK
jgi:hypothetical protein